MSDGAPPTTPRTAASPSSSLGDAQALGISWDSEELKQQPKQHPPQANDRRKQFDSTTPTLIDEVDEEESEMMGLSYDRSEPNEMRRTPGASMYKSERLTRKTPGAALQKPKQQHQQQQIQPPIKPSFGFGLTLSTPVASDESPSKMETTARARWDSYDASPRSEQTEGTAPKASPTNRPPGLSGGPYSFAPWAKQPGTTMEGRRSGSFSPNILRLTEDLGNLLQEDEDDKFTLEIPSVIRGSGETTGSADVDWTGNYVYDSEHRKPATVVSRATAGARGMAESVVIRRSPGPHKTQQRKQPPQQVADFLPHAKQPEPRRNEVFDMQAPRKTQDNSQPLVFGGAFAPPAFGSGFVRGEVSQVPRTASPYLSQETNRPRVASMPEGPPEMLSSQEILASQGHAGLGQPPGMREHAQSFDSYQAARAGFGTPSPVYGMPAYAHLPEMHATAREFVPQTTQSSTPQYGHLQPQSQQQWAQQLEAPLEQASWHSSTSYGYSNPGMGYGIPSSQPSYVDPRATMTPSPHLQQWPQQPQQSHPIQQAVDHSSVYSGDHSGSYSGVARGDYSKTNPQEYGVQSQLRTATSKKEATTKRRQRGKKKLKPDTSGQGRMRQIMGTKKKNKGDGLSTTQSSEGQEELSASEDPADVKRTELVESPQTRIAFKEFYRAFRAAERESFQKAEEFARKALDNQSLPESVHWRVFLELADLAKRSNRYREARVLYEKVCELQPYASQGWLEYSKLEEECGRMNRVMNILHKGLSYCEFSENLLTRAVKHQEKMGDLAKARGLLARLKHAGIEKVWRTVLEGALLEARAGNVSTARKVLKYLMHHVPWYGPLYLEAYRLEKDQGYPIDSLHIVERGLQAIPRYGPLWFGAFRLCEEMDMSKQLFHLPSSMKMIERAAVSISKELVWKVHLEAAQMLERAALEQNPTSNPAFDSLLFPARRRLAITILTCPNNLRWKVWLASARMELEFGNTDRARLLFLKAHEVVPKKGRSSTLLECARLEEFVGELELAQAILCKGRLLFGNDWKVWLESVAMEMRKKNFMRALQLCDKALQYHQGTGRLWATLVQLRQFDGRDKAQQNALRRALNAVPKSGEVWCEGGRVHLNPFSDTFDIERARRHLEFATRFTPQYGDGFVETIRLELIAQWLAPIAAYIWNETRDGFRPAEGSFADDVLTKYILDVSLAISVASQPESESSKRTEQDLVHRDIVPVVRDMLSSKVQHENIDLNDVRLACVNADPNYGLLWFHCRKKSTDTPRRIIEDAAGVIIKELRTYARLYLAALIRREAVLSITAAKMEPGLETADREIIQWENHIDAKLYAAPSLGEIFNLTDPATGTVFSKSPVDGSFFATGLIELNAHSQIESMTLSDRRRALFGNDALFP